MVYLTNMIINSSNIMVV